MRTTPWLLLLLLGACSEEPASAPAPLEPRLEAAATPAPETAPVLVDAASALPAGTAVAPAALDAEAAADQAEAPAVEGTPIVLVTLDTLRRDHLGCYGYFRDTSPRIDAFARESLQFDRALATMASTFPSHLSMLTGLYPHQHGRTSNQDAVHEQFVPSQGCATLARALHDAGWTTAAFVSSRVLVENTGINDGFELYDCPRPADNPARARRTVDRALQWLKNLRPGPPLFLWVHMWDAHEPNDPEEPYASMFTSDEKLQAWIAAHGIEAAALQEKFATDPALVERFFGDPKAEKGKTIADRYEERRARKKKHRPREPVQIDAQRLAGLWNRYDACVRALDDQVGRLFDGLKESGLWDRAIVVLVADHGQSLGENLYLGHGRITNVNTFVPFLLHLPGDAAPRRDPRLVSLVDLTPTVLGRFEPGFLAEFRGQLEGRDVLASDFDRPYVLVEEATQFHGTAGHDLTCALIEGRWKYVRAPEKNELYDLEGSGEGVDVLAEHWDDGVRLHTELEELMKRTPRIGQGTEVPAEQVEELMDGLRDLGYVDDE